MIRQKIVKWVYRQRPSRHAISNKEIIDRLELAIVSKRLFLEPAITQVKVASEIAVNRTYLNRALKSINMTYAEYINSFRLQYAMKMIFDKPLYSLCEVAELSGFGTQKTMDSYMKRMIGTTSATIRRRDRFILKKQEDEEKVD